VIQNNFEKTKKELLAVCCKELLLRKLKNKKLKKLMK